MSAQTTETVSNEVMLAPGYCIVWRCYEPAKLGSVACEGHAWDFAPKAQRTAQPVIKWTPEEQAAFASMPPRQRHAARNREYARRRRLVEPGWNSGQAHVKKAEQRRLQIAAYLAEHGTAGTADLAVWFNTSTDAIKRDLAALADRGLIRRVWGGAARPDLEGVRGGRNVGRQQLDSSTGNKVKCGP